MASNRIVIDRSLLQKVCEIEDADRRNQCLRLISSTFRVIIPTVLVEEVWVNWSDPKSGELPATKAMVDFLHEPRNRWIADDVDIAYLELTQKRPITRIPPPPSDFKNSFQVLMKNDPATRKFFSQRNAGKKVFINDILQQQLENQEKMDEGGFNRLLEKPGDILETFVIPVTSAFLSTSPGRKSFLQEIIGNRLYRRLLTEEKFSILKKKKIDEGLQEYDFGDRIYQTTTNSILAILVYFYAPLFLVNRRQGSPSPLLSKGKKAQRNNFDDARYIVSALLVDGLLTRDRGMSQVMDIFRSAGRWGGRILYIDDKADVVEGLDAAIKEWKLTH